MLLVMVLLVVLDDRVEDEVQSMVFEVHELPGNEIAAA